jgi:hypothetical protein
MLSCLQRLDLGLFGIQELPQGLEALTWINMGGWGRVEVSGSLASLTNLHKLGLWSHPFAKLAKGI